MKYLVGLTLVLFAALATAQEVTLFIDGVEVEVPENKKLVVVPSHWDVADVYRESHRANDITVLLPAEEDPCDEDELTLGGYCK